MKSSTHDRLPLGVHRALTKLGHDIAVARRKRRLTMAMMAERVGASKATYVRVERGDPTVGMGIYAMTLFVLGLGTPLGDLADPGNDDQALLLESERLPTRVRPRKEPADL